MLKDAIALLEMEVERLSQTKPGATLWYVRQAKSIGLSFLRVAETKQLEEPTVLEEFRRTLREAIVKDVSSSPPPLQ